MNNFDRQNPVFWWMLTLCLVTLIVSHFYVFTHLSYEVDAQKPSSEMDVAQVVDLSFAAYDFPSTPTKLATPAKLAAPAATLNSAAVSPTSDKSATAIEHRTYEQNPSISPVELQDLASITMMINMPHSETQKRALGKFLYQCVKIGFGYIPSNFNSESIQVIRPSTYQHSAIFRITNTSFFTNEKHWRQAYGQQQQYVRIYPSWFDERLLHQINQNTKGEKLTSLNATYVFQQNLLQLKDIQLNGRPLAQVWSLANGYELGCY